MKAKILSPLLTLLLIPSLMGAFWGDSATVEYGDMIKVKDNVSQDDVGFSTDSVDVAGFELIRMDVDVNGTTPSWDITPECSNDTVWLSGTTSTITEDSVYSVDLAGCKSINIRTDNSSGTTPSCNVWITPYNAK